MDFKLGNVRVAIAEYVRQNPGGQDVTAYVLSRLGRVDVEKYAHLDCRDQPRYLTQEACVSRAR